MKIVSLGHHNHVHGWPRLSSSLSQSWHCNKTAGLYNAWPEQARPGRIFVGPAFGRQWISWVGINCVYGSRVLLRGSSLDFVKATVVLSKVAGPALSKCLTSKVRRMFRLMPAFKFMIRCVGGLLTFVGSGGNIRPEQATGRSKLAVYHCPADPSQSFR